MSVSMRIDDNNGELVNSTIQGNVATTTQYGNVLHKDKRGTIILSTSKFIFTISKDDNNNTMTTTDNTITTTMNNNNNTENMAPQHLQQQQVVLLDIDWKDIVKHQVSPIKYPKSLLKIILVHPLTTNNSTTTSTTATNNNQKSSNTSMTFQMENRDDLERIRKDITDRLHDRTITTPLSSSNNNNSNNNNKKRSYSEIKSLSSTSSSFGTLDPTAMAVSRAALLASNNTLRQQYNQLVTETNTISEDDFWMTHDHLLIDEYAKIIGMTRPGSTSMIQSHLPNSGRITLGVQEMRQIFILYPAVHKAYEEKVPLELSDEQFWRKYLESEYFHRDRGRIGTASRNHTPLESARRKENEKNGNNSSSNTATSNAGGPTYEQQEARAAAVGSDDLFSRYDQKLKEEIQQRGNNDTSHRRYGKNLAIGQFDLASTLETERGKLLEGPKDNHPPNQNDDGKGARVVQKYNRHWAVVLYPDDAVAGSNLMDVARQSVNDTIQDDTDASLLGGVDIEMRRLVDFADAREEDANHAIGRALYDGEDYEPLTLQNIESYFTGSISNTNDTLQNVRKLHVEYAKKMFIRTQSLLKKITSNGANVRLPDSCFPPPSLGRDLLSALSKKMAKDSETEARYVEMANKLPIDLRNRLQAYFRRSSELLRHFFGLRRLSEQQNLVKPHDPTNNVLINQKLARIVSGMDTLYREMETMRKALTQTETDEMMRKMCLPIMDQLDWAFKLHREGSGGGSSGGFVTVDEI